MRKLVNINKVYKVKKGEDVKALDNINLGLLDKGFTLANSVSIFVIEGGVIAIITALVSSLFTIIGRYILNTIFRNMISISGTIFASNYLIFAIIFAICILTALISVLISSTKIMKQNTIDIVRSE